MVVKAVRRSKSKSRESDEPLQAFGSKHDIISLEDKENDTLQRLNELNESLTKAEADRMAKEALYKQAKDKNFESLPSILENKLIMDLKQAYIQLEAQYKSAFLKANTYRQLLVIDASDELLRGLPAGKTLKIKLEVDTDPPGGFETESRYLLQPIPFGVRVYRLPDLFAGKLHAVLCRKWKSRMKGRDWYDFAWYTARRTPANYTLLSSALDQLGPWMGGNVRADRAWCLERLQERIKAIDWKQAREDVRRLVRSNESPSLEPWSAVFFLAQAAKLA